MDALATEPGVSSRMDEAEALLLDTDCSIAQIARAVGYADAFGFSAAFKHHRGVSPSAFRAATPAEGAPRPVPLGT